MSEAIFGIGRMGTAAAAAHPRRVTAEAHSLMPWLPVALGLGIGLYFRLPVEPPVWSAAALPGLAVAMAAIAWAGGRLGLGAQRVLPLAAALCIGFALTQMRTAGLSTPMLMESADRVGLEATVERIEHLPEGVRVRLSHVTFERPQRLAWTLDAPPEIRLRLTKNSTVPRAGDRIRLLADLFPFSGPVAPGAYDFRRDAFFKGIGATGYAISRATIVQEAPPPEWQRAVEATREAIGARIAARLDGDIAAIAEALLTGEQTAISEAALLPFRDSGLSHIFSISGLHIGLAAGIVFFTVRLLLALVPGVALRFDIKRGAAIAALIAAWAYTALVDFPIPAQRSAIMASLALIAIFFDRDPFSLRVIALAAAAVLVTTPESLLSPSFQLSFAAVLGLICGWQALEPILSLHHPGASWARRMAYAVTRTFISSLIASLATVPLLIFHFHTAQFYAPLANALALPLMGVLVMPATVLTYIAMPLGLDAFTLPVLGQGLTWLLWIAQTVAALPGASVAVAPLPLPVLIAIVALGLWLCLGPKRWRLIGWAALPLLLLGPLLSTPPLALVAQDGGNVALRTADGVVVMVHGKAKGFVAEQWNGALQGVAVKPSDIASKAALRCDRLGCTLRLEDQRLVSVALDRQAVAEDCETAALVIAPRLKVSGACNARLIDAANLHRSGAHAVWATENGFRIESVAQSIGRRPWVPPTQGDQ
jgi:competence protein ComEC